MKFLVDMNMSPRWVEVLREAGFDSIHWREIGAPDAPDEVLFRYAAEHGFAVLTHDLDFGTILAVTGAASPSVIQLRDQDVDPETTSSRVLAGVELCRELIERGALVTIDAKRSKARVLPLR